MGVRSAGPVGDFLDTVTSSIPFVTQILLCPLANTTITEADH